ncbi:MAG: hypothetical protein F2793_04215 [Actinobacteria bacterium]|nr:hypothetical protein [Actinomycetota bacterium]
MTPKRPSRSLVLAGFALVALTLFGPASAASAAGEIEPAAAALRSGASVYSDPAAEKALSSSEISALSDQIAATKLPIFMAVLPASAGADADAVLVELKDAVGLGGIYAVVAGDSFRAGSTSGSAGALATSAFRSQRDNGVAAVLGEFVSLADAQFNGSGAAGQPARDTAGGGTETVVLLVMFFGAAVVLVVVIVRRRRRQALQLAQVRTAIDEDVTEFGERLGRFDTTNSSLDEGGLADMQRALDDYESAKSSAVAMRSASDASRVTASLEDGRFAVACVEARLRSQPLPERRAPCFVDPRHGPSVADIQWQAPGLSMREVPMCAACRTDVETGNNPLAREVDTGSGRQPYWQAGSQFAPYAQGYYSPFGNVMGAVLMGTMLSSMWSSPGITSAASGVESAGFGGWGSGGGGGDFGGGDFGGGDF